MNEFNILIEKHYRSNFNALRNRVSRRAESRHNAEDVVQNAYVNALTYQDTYDDKLSFDKWFSRILSNSLKKYKRDHRMAGMVVDIRDMDILPAPSISQMDKNLLIKIKTMIDREPENKATILHLHFLKQYKPSEICDIVPETNGAIRNIIYRFRKTLVEA